MIGAVLTVVLEHVMHRPAQEVGPAATPSARRDVKLLREDRWLYPAGAISALFGVALAAIIIPFGPNLVAEDIGIGAFYFIVVVDFVVLGVALAGWARTQGARWTLITASPRNSSPTSSRSGSRMWAQL